MLLSLIQTVDAQKQRYLYVSNWNDAANSISGFSVNNATGALTALPGFPIPGNGHPFGLTAHPNKRFLYLAAEKVQGVFGYRIDSATGRLSALPGSPFPAGPDPTGIAISPSGRFAYVNSTLSNRIYGYSVDANSGQLSPLAGSPFQAQGTSGMDEPGTPVIDPGGRFLFAPNYRSSTVSVYAVDQITGTLAPVPNSPFSTPRTRGLGKNSVDPTGRFLYLTDLYNNTIHAWTIAGNGELASIPGSPFPSGPYNQEGAGRPTTLVLDRQARFAYVSNQNGNTIAVFSVDPVSGVLSALPGSPFPFGSGTTAFTLSPDGAFAWFANDTGSSISLLKVDKVSGTLSLIPGGTYTTPGTEPVEIALVDTGAGAFNDYCGALDVTLLTSFKREGFFGVPPLFNVDAQRTTLTNTGTDVIRGPIYLVHEGLPRFDSQYCPNGCNVTSREATTCSGSSETSLSLLTARDLGPGQSVVVNLTYSPAATPGSPQSKFAYNPRILSGKPSN